MPSVNAGSIAEKMTQAEVFEFVADALGIPCDGLSSGTLAADIPEWDSIGFMSLLLELDQAGVECDMGDTGALQSMEGILGLFRAAGKLE